MKNDTGLTLTGDRILVLPPKVEETTKGGIVIVDATKEKEERAVTTGILVAVGPDAMAHRNMKGVKIGDNLFYARYAGDNVPLTKNGMKYRVMNAADVVGVLDSEPDSQFKAAQSTVEVYGLADQLT
jgi:chaperonin GroES